MHRIFVQVSTEADHNALVYRCWANKDHSLSAEFFPPEDVALVYELGKNAFVYVLPIDACLGRSRSRQATDISISFVSIVSGSVDRLDFYSDKVTKLSVPTNLRKDPVDEVSTSAASGQTEFLTPPLAENHRLMDYHWPGNVRELQNIIERGVALSSAATLDAADIYLDDPAKRSSAPGSFPYVLPSGVTLEQWEDEAIREALRHANGNKSQAARALGLSRNALRYRLSKLGVPDPADSEN